MATKYTVKGIQSELQNVTSENDAVTRHTINSNTNRLYAQNNCGIYEHIGEGLSCIASATSVRVNVGMGCLYGRDFEVLSNTLVEVEQNTSGFIVAVYDGNVVDGKERFYLTSIKNTDSYIQQDLLNDGKTFMMKLCGYVATTQVDDIIDVEIAQLNDESLLSEVTTLSDTKANKSDLNKKVDKIITDSLDKYSNLGTRTDGTPDFTVWSSLQPDSAYRYIGLRLVDTLGNYHGFLFNENVGRMQAYIGNGTSRIDMASTTDLDSYVKKILTGTSQKVVLSNYNGNASTPFYAHAYVNSSGYNSVKLINTFPKGEQGFYVHENGAFHVNNGSAKQLAYNSDLYDYAKLSGATFTGGITGTSLRVSGAVVTNSVQSTGNVTVDAGRIDVSGTAYGLIHTGTGTTQAQNIATTNYSDGNRRATFRDDTLSASAMYLTGYNTDGTTITRGISMLDDYVRHFTKSGPRSLAHLDEIKSTSLQAAKLLQTQQEQIELLATIVAQDNPEVLKTMKASRNEVDAFVKQIENELIEVQENDILHGEILKEEENGNL